MKNSKQPGQYAKRVRTAMRSIVDPATEGPMTIRGLERITKQLNHGFSYEHLRKCLSGEPVISQDCNDIICKILNLNAAEMWQLALTEKAIRRFGSMSVNMAAPDDSRMKEMWPRLPPEDQQLIIRQVEGLLAGRELADRIR